VTAGPPGPVDGRPAAAGPGGRSAAGAGAVVGAACVALHAVTALAAGGEAAWERGLLLVMAAACVPCILRLRQSPTRRVWATTGGMYAAMLAVHLCLVAPWSTGHMAGHMAGQMAGHMTGPLTWADLGMWGGLGLAAVQVALAAGVLLARPVASAARQLPAGDVLPHGVMAPGGPSRG
jgi:hypothetical protein